MEKSNELVYLFQALKSDDEMVERYIKKGVDDGVDQGYSTGKRNPWYSLENRPPAPIWASVFNRNGLIFIRNEANVSNLTTFHCVYFKGGNLSLCITIDLFFAYLMTDVAHDIFNDNKREYGNGLNKFEPNDLNKSKMLDLSTLSLSTICEILSLYNMYRKELRQEYLSKINEIFEVEYSA